MNESADIADEGRVAEVANSIAEDRIFYVFQDVLSVFKPNEVLYSECLVRLIGQDGRIYSAEWFIPSLDALRLVPMLDRHMVKLVLDLLEADPVVILGCNLSADNFEDAQKWRAILGQIQQRPHLASRLVLEVTETQNMCNPQICAELIAEVRRLGCRIALDDFGSGFASPRLLQLLDFDIVKIDQAFVRNIRPSLDGRSSLQNIVGFASSYAPVVVVEGIETAEQFDAASTAGATHCQGCFFSGEGASGTSSPRNAELTLTPAKVIIQRHSCADGRAGARRLSWCHCTFRPLLARLSDFFLPAVATPVSHLSEIALIAGRNGSHAGALYG